MDAIYAMERPLSASFLDFTNDGAVDLLIVSETDGGFAKGGLGVTMHTFRNTYFFDAFFLKPCVLNGVCPGGTCPLTFGSIPHLADVNKTAPASARPYGVNYVGATLKYSITDTKGHLRVAQVAQLSQQAYMPLLSSWQVLGLGRTNNYIEDLFVGVSRRERKGEKTTRHVANYQGIIPNAALVISPYENPSERSSQTWTLELYMNPSSTTTALIWVLVIVLVLLAMVVSILEMAERREDEREKRMLLHAVNFDAL